MTYKKLILITSLILSSLSSAYSASFIERLKFSCKSAINRLSQREILKKKSTSIYDYRESLQEFREKYPNHMKMMKKIEVTFNEYNLEDYNKSTDILVISSHGMTPNQQDKLLSDYTAHFSKNMVSFTGKGHLYIRMKEFVYDFVSDQVNKDHYYLSTENRFEPVLILSDKEYEQLAKYINNAHEKPIDVVGPMDIEGPTKLNLNPTLDNNIPESGHHNCASWLCHAPIGSNSKTLIELLGVDGIMERPEALMAWLGQKASADRSPFAIYWTDQKLDHNFKDIIKDGPFDPLGMEVDPYEEIYNYAI